MVKVRPNTFEGSCDSYSGNSLRSSSSIDICPNRGYLAISTWVKNGGFPRKIPKNWVLQNLLIGFENWGPFKREVPREGNEAPSEYIWRCLAVPGEKGAFFF